MARSKGFASVIVNDLPVDCHVPIGSNLTGLVGYTMASLGEKLAGRAPEAVYETAKDYCKALTDESTPQTEVCLNDYDVVVVQ